MNEMIRSGVVKPASGIQNTAYILENNHLFLMTDYKVLKSQEKKGFLKCSKLLYNGKIKLVYFSSGYKSLQNMLSSMDADMFLSVVASLLGAVIEIQGNGFLSCQNLDLSMDKIFVDPSTLTTHLVYLPVHMEIEEQIVFENELRTKLIKVIHSSPALMSEKVHRVCSQLADGALSFSQLYQEICRECKGVESKRKEPERMSYIGDIRKEEKELKFIAMDSPTHLCFEICQSEFVIGKNPSLVDGAITFNKAISRSHCKIMCYNSKYYLVDLDSANGTYLNGEKLIAHKEYPLKNGDRVRLANSDFSVQI